MLWSMRVLRVSQKDRKDGRKRESQAKVRLMPRDDDFGHELQV